jgi:uncharacterized protein (DUF488 family)
MPFHEAPQAYNTRSAGSSTSGIHKVMKLPFFTIGHSNRGLDEFVELLKSSDIRHVVDIRTMPGSKTNPQFNRETFSKALAAAGISYEHVAALGGLRKKSKTIPPEVNAFWTNASFHNYADYALSSEFHAGLDHVIKEYESKGHCVLMCSEAVWWRCHRRLVTDDLIARRATVFHIMGRGRVEAAQLTPEAVVQAGETVVYPSARSPQMNFADM